MKPVIAITVSKLKDEVERYKDAIPSAYAQAVAESIGIDRRRSSNFVKDPIGVGVQFSSLNQAIRSMRNGEEVGEEWKADLEEDLKRAKK